MRNASVVTYRFPNGITGRVNYGHYGRVLAVKSEARREGVTYPVRRVRGVAVVVRAKMAAVAVAVALTVSGCAAGTVEWVPTPEACAGKWASLSESQDEACELAADLAEDEAMATFHKLMEWRDALDGPVRGETE